MTDMTPAMLEMLKAELTSDPGARGYAGQTVEQQVTLINTPYTVIGQPPPAVATDLSIAALETIIVPTGEAFKISQLANTAPTGGPNDAAISAAWSLMLMVNKWTSIPTSDAATWASLQAGMAALESAGVLSNASVQAVNAQVMKVPVPPITEHNARVMEVFMGVDNAPNQISVADITGALAQ